MLRHQTDYTLISLPNDLNTWVGTFGIQNNPSPMTMRLNQTKPSTQPTSHSVNISTSHPDYIPTTLPPEQKGHWGT
ncbi:hypothetical protein ikelab_14730 [Lactococcus garvieae]|uniref:Uncharacterized protein n=1 Tax=Lactococcus garvieae TaxID=1363 RepID=A0A6L2ZWJ5_9LACT|nr:hypothetical protein ikelab_14730 [Lactococcus garvieae]